MPRVGQTVYVPDQRTAGPTLLPLSQIPPDVIADAEECYNIWKTQGQSGRFRQAWETKQEAERYAMQLRSYCEQREGANGPAPIRFRRSPVRNGSPNVVEFTIKDIDPEAEANKEANRAVKNAQAKVEATKTAPKKMASHTSR